MTSLNSKLQLALLNRKKGRNLLEKGFTLVELMIVIVIVGVLSAVALPNFLNQTSKAKATECTTNMTSLLKQVHADYQLDGNASEAIKAIQAATGTAVSTDSIYKSSDTGFFNYAVGFPGAATNTQIQIKCQAYGTKVTKLPNAKQDNSLKDQGMYGCINLESGKIALSKRLLASGAPYDLGTECGAANTTTAVASLI